MSVVYEPRAPGVQGLVSRRCLWRVSDLRCRFGDLRRGRLVLTAGFGAVAVALGALAVRHFAETSWPLTSGAPALLVAVGALFVCASAFKAYGWQRLFGAGERPRPLALAAANGGASVLGVALPGRFDDVV